MQSRRHLLKSLALGSATLVLPIRLGAEVTKPKNKIRIGVITDIHIGYQEDAEDRLSAFLSAMEAGKPDALVQIGDFAYPNAQFKKHSDRFNAAHPVTFHTIGNHDLDKGLTADDCVKIWGMPAPYYAKDLNGIRVIVLNGNEKGSPTHGKHGGYPSYIGPEQQAWLTAELEKSTTPVLVFCHQPFAGVLELDNARDMRALLTSHKNKIIACINGHAHIDHHIEVDGVHYLHINSASYYWLGGKVSKASYTDPLFAAVTYDPQAGTLTIRGRKSTWANGTPEDVDYFTGNRADWKEFVKPEISDRRIVC